MEDYISRKEAIERFMFEHGDYIPETNLDGSPVMACVKDIKSVLRSIPGADVLIIVHAKWEMIGKITSRCSNCKHCELSSRANDYSYCPYCGARMDG